MKNKLLVLLLILILPIAFFILRKDITKTSEELRSKYELESSDYSNWRNGKMHYVEFGDGTPIVFIHGFAGSFLNWKTTWHNIPKGYRIIAVDLPGFGLSDKTQEREGEDFIDMYCEYISHLMNELNLDSVYLVGNSMGGYISWEMAYRNPDRIKKLVLVNSGGYDLDKVGRIFIKLSRSKFYDFMFSKGIPFSLSKRAAINSMSEKPKDENIISFYDLMNRKETIQTIGKLGGSKQLADTGRIAQINVPTLIIWGENDKVIDVKDAHRFHRDILGSELKIFKNVGHVPMIESPDLFAMELVNFLNMN